MSLEALAPGGSRRVDVEAIEKELARLWKEASPPDAGGREAVTRTCLLTLVAFQGRGRGGPRVHADVAGLFRARPCRVLLLAVDGSLDGDSVSAFISAHCTRPAGDDRQVCCEQVTLVSPPGATAHLPALARALTVSDLPVVLYFPGEAPEDPGLMDKLCSASDKVVYDSAGLPPGEAAALFRRAGSGGRTAAADLEWGRTWPHRASMAGLFDSPLLQPLLGEVTGVSTSGGEGSGSGAALLHGWVRAALEEPSLPAEHGESPDRAPGMVHGLILMVRDGSRILVERGETPEILVSRAEMPRTCPLPACRRFPVRSPAELLCEEVDRTGQDPVFARAVEMSALGPETRSAGEG